MFYYLTSPAECAVKLDGAYVGKCTENYFVFEAEETLLELVPLDGERLPIAFITSPNSRTSPNMKVYDLKGGILLVPIFSRRQTTNFKMIGYGKTQFSQGSVSVACYAENGVKLSVQTPSDALVESLPCQPDKVKFERISNGKTEYLICFFIGKKTYVYAYDLTKGITLAFRRKCDDYSLVPPRLALTERVNDTLRHVVYSSWIFADKIIGESLEVKRKRALYSIDETLLPYCFFEEVLIGGDLRDFLSPTIKSRADKFRDFLGEYNAVLPPPHFVDQSRVLLLYSDTVRYAEVCVSSGLISNVVLHDA